MKYYKQRIIPLNILITLITSLIVIICLVCFLFIHNIEVSLNGDKNITIVVGSDYQDEGIKLLDNNKEINKDLLNITISSDVDISTLGSYKMKYNIEYRHKNYEIERTINVIDNIPPVIEINEQLYTKNFCNNKNDEYKAIDNYDGDITSKVIKERINNYIHYEVSDSSNNITTIDKEVIYKDISKPTIKLDGNTTMYILLNNEYKEPGYVANDNCDGDITNKVVITNNIDITKEGTYEISYTVSDSKDNTTTVKRKVIVSSLDLYSIKNKESEITNYLKQYNVSVIYYDLTSGYKYEYRPNQAFFGASLIKTLAALYVYEKMDVTNELKNLVEPTIKVSNNNTYIRLVNKIGLNKYKQYGTNLGLKYANNLSSDKYFVSTNASDQLILWKKLWNFINNNKKGNELKSYFINDNARYLDFDGLPEVMHKYGYSEQYFHDVGIVLDIKPYIIIVLTKEGNHNYGTIINNISKKIYELHKLVR